MNESGDTNGVTMPRMGRRVAGVVLFAAVVVSWFVWGPVGIIAYVGGLFNSVDAFIVMFMLGALIAVAAVYLPALTVFTALRWRRLTGRERRLRLFVVAVCAALVASFALVFTGATPAPFDMFLRGFARYAKVRADIPAIQSWLGTLDPGEYSDGRGYMTEKQFVGSEQPPCVARLHPKLAKVEPNDKGRLILRMTWGGGFAGHWGIEVGDKTMEPPADSEAIGYQPLAPGAWIWSELY